MKSTVKLAFSAVVLGAAVYWGAGHVAATNRTSTPDSTSASGSADSRWGSPPVNRAARPSDPIPKETTMSERAKRFAAQEKEWQRLSTP
jgi:hypothetical protein